MGRLLVGCQALLPDAVYPVQTEDGYPQYSGRNDDQEDELQAPSTAALFTHTQCTARCGKSTTYLGIKKNEKKADN